MMRIAAVTMMVLLASTATAQFEGVVDGFGIFFDEEATTYCVDLEADPDHVSVAAYLALINAGTDQPKVLAWEGRLVIDSNFHHVGEWYAFEATMGLPPPCMGGNCLTGTDLPITRPVTLLAFTTLVFVGNAERPYARISIDRLPGSLTFENGPGYMAGPDLLYEAMPVNASFGEPSAWVNHPDGPCATVPDEDLAWGAVKALYD